MTAEMILLYGVVAKAGIDLLQLGLIGWGLRRWGKDIEKRRVVLDEQAARWAKTSPGLAAARAALREATAASQARRAEAG